MDMHLFRFLWIQLGAYDAVKVSTIDVLWNLKDVPLIWLWQVDNLGHLKLSQGLSNLVPFCPIWVNDASKSIEKDKIINNGLSKYMEFWRLGMWKDEPMLDSLIHMWIIEKTSLSCWQILCQLKVQHSWKVPSL